MRASKAPACARNRASARDPVQTRPLGLCQRPERSMDAGKWDPTSAPLGPALPGACAKTRGPACQRSGFDFALQPPYQGAPEEKIMTLAPKPGVLDIAPYVGGRASVPGVAAPIKLSSNEGALGASPKALAAYSRAAADASIYPEGSAKILRQAIGEAYGLDPARIVCGNGSDELLTLLGNAYLRPGDEVLFSEHAFLVYRIATLANSGV